MASGKRYLGLAEGRAAIRTTARRCGAWCATAPTRWSSCSIRSAPGRATKGCRSSPPSRRRLRIEPTTAIVGVATAGGRFPPAWKELLRGCVEAGLDLENGLHEFLTNDPELVALAVEHGVELRDLRKPPAGLNVPTGENLEVAGTIVLTVGSDCAIGKMTMALELDREAQRRGLESVFVPTGQTGIAIAGWGIAVDAVVADFIAGATERLVVEGSARGGELLWVEGQGSLSHPAYSGVTLGLIHGAAPHAFVLCHQAGSTEIEGFPGHPLAAASRARRAARGDLAPRAAGEGRRDRAEHAHARRGGRAAGNRRRGDGDRARRRRSGAIRGGETARCSPACLRLDANTRSLYDRTHVRTGRSRGRASRPCRRVQRTQLDQRRARADLPRSLRGHALVDRGVALRRATRARRSGASRTATTSARWCTPASGSSCRRTSLDLPGWTWTSSSSARRGSMPTADRAPTALIDPARGRAPALRLRRGHAAPAAPLERRPRRSARGLPHPLPRRPLPRAAGDAEDVRAPRPRGADHDLRAARARRPVRLAAADLRKAHLSVRTGRAEPGDSIDRGGLPPRRRSRSRTASRRSATRSSRMTGRAASTSRRPTHSASRTVRSAARSSAASRSRLRTGRVVTPDQVLGPAAAGRTV